MFEDDRTRLQHMLDAAREAVGAVRGRTREDLDRNHVWGLGLVKCVEIIGEAAGRVGRDAQERYGQIPWRQIVAMRNRLVHAYFEIDNEQLWKALTEDVPPLIEKLEKILE